MHWCSVPVQIGDPIVAPPGGLHMNNNTETWPQAATSTVHLKSVVTLRYLMMYFSIGFPPVLGLAQTRV